MTGWGERRLPRDRAEVVEPPRASVPPTRLAIVHMAVRARRRALALGEHGRMVDAALIDLLREIDQALVEMYGEPRHAFLDTRQHHSENERGCGWCGEPSDAPVHLTEAGIRIEL